jgi:hypothetical protein
MESEFAQAHLRRRARGLTYRAIAEKLAAENAPTAHGGRWHPETIRSIVATER